MKTYLTYIIIFISLFSFGQSAIIDTLVLPDANLFGEQHYMSYPLIKTGNIKVDSLINIDLRNKYTDNKYETESIDSSLIKWGHDGITDLNFEVTYNKNGIISLNISAEGCGAYCSYWTEYYNYSTITGNPLTLDSIVNLKNLLSEKINNDKNEQFQKCFYELKEGIKENEAEIDSATYKIALEYYQNCFNSFNPNNFSLNTDFLEIIVDCYLPNVMKNLSPVIELKYRYSEIINYLIIKN